MTRIALETQMREKGIVAAGSVVAAIFLTALKLGIGLATGSLGILAEAAHSGLDLAAAAITFFAVRVSDRPADESHLYGHGKVENISALAETVLLLITCGWIVYEALNRLLFNRVEVHPSAWAFLVMGVSIIIDLSRSTALGRIARKYQSQALEADALHFRTDVWSSTVVIVGLALVWYGQATGQPSIFVQADAVAALMVALIVVNVSLRLSRRAIDALVDRAPHGLADHITAAAAAVKGVQRVTRTRVRTVGSQVFVELNVAVPRHLSFEESHEITRQVQDAVHALSPNADVSAHAFPVAENEGVLESILAIAAREHLAIHNVTTHLTQRGMWIDLDLEVDPDINFERAHALATDLETQLRADLTEYGRGHLAPTLPTQVVDVNVHIEPRAEELAKGIEIAPGHASRYIERLSAIRREIPHARECQDIALQRLDGQVYLACHLLIDADVPITEAHRIAEEMENRLRREFPELGRVVIHTEPYPNANP